VNLLKFGIALEDNLSGTAKKAAAQMKDLATQLKGAQKQLAGYEAELKKAQTLGDAGAFTKYQHAIGATTEHIGQLGNAWRTASLESTGTLEGILPLAGAVAAGVAVAAGAIVGFGYAATSLAEYAEEVVSANNLMIASFDALGAQGEGSGKKMLGVIDELATRLPTARGQLAEYAKEINALGIVDLDETRAQVVALASAQAIMGDTGAAAYLKITKRVNEAVEAHHGLKLAGKTLTQLYAAGVNVTDVATRMGQSVKDLEAGLKAGTTDAAAFGEAIERAVIDKGRGPMQALNESLGVLRAKGAETFAHLFDDINVAPLTDAIQSVIDLGDQGEPSGQVLKRGITAGVNGIIQALGYGITEAEIFFLKLEIYAVELEIKFRPLIRALEKIGVLGSADVPGPQDASKKVPGASSLGSDLLDTISGSQQAFSLGGPIVGAAYALGSGIVTALAAGIRSDVGDVSAAGSEMGGAAIDGARKKVDAHSPSRVALKLGAFTGAGFGLGVLSARPMVQQAGARVGGAAVGGIGFGASSFAATPNLAPRIGRRIAAQGLGPSLSESLRGNSGSFGASRVGGGIHIESVTVQAPHGITNAQDVTVTGLTIALERMQLAAGR
jgi:hypothetical protein